MKLMTHNAKRGLSAIALIEREHWFYGIDVTGKQRTVEYPNYALLPAQNARTSNTIGGTNVTVYSDVIAREWGPAYFQMGDTEAGTDNWGMAFWDGTNKTFTLGPGIADQDGDWGAKPKPVMVIDDGAGPYTPEGEETPRANLYVVAQSSEGLQLQFADNRTFVLHWIDGADPLPNQTNSEDWWFRSATETEMDDGSNFGYGFSGSFHSGVDLKIFVLDDPDNPWPTFASDPLRDADATHHAGFGKVWRGFLRIIFKHSNDRWYALARGYLYDNESDPLGTSPAFYAANALLRLNVGEVPTNIPAWTNIQDIFASYDVDNPHSELGGTSIDHNAPHMWVERHGSDTFFTASPVLPLSSATIPSDARGFDDTAVWCLDSGGTLHKSAVWLDDSCWGGPMCQLGGSLFFPMISASEQKLYIFRLQSSPDSWELVASTSVTINLSFDDPRNKPLIATAHAANGRIYVVYGRQPTVWNDAPITGANALGTGWQMKTWVQSSSGGFVTLQDVFPGPNAEESDNGLWARMWNITADTGVVPVPDDGGTCDGFSIYGAPTITLAVFSAWLSAYSSPILSEHSASYWWSKLTTAGIDPNFALAIWKHESQMGSVPGEVGLSAHNIGNIRPHSWGLATGVVHTTCCGDFSTYATWDDGITDWIDLWGLSIYAGKTIPEAIAIYAPATENNTSAYILDVCSGMAARKAESGL